MDFKLITKDEQMQILTDEYKRLEWGHFFPSTAQVGVGARMILDEHSLSFLNDRVSWMDGDKVLNKKAADVFTENKLAGKLFEFIQKNGITGSSDAMIAGELNGYQLLATPNASYGYLYLSFWAV